MLRTGIIVEVNQTCGVTRAEPVCSSTSVVPDKTAPHPGARLPSPTKVCKSQEVSQSLQTISRKAESRPLPTRSQTAKVGTFNCNFVSSFRELCAAILPACLFCQPLDCLLASSRGCNSCIWSLCTSVCGSKSSSLQPLVGITHHCDLCGPPCCLCSFCDICPQASECLDFAMEISQMLYH